MRMYEELIDILITEDVERIGSFEAGEQALKIATAYRHCAMPPRELVERIASKAAKAGVPVDQFGAAA